MNPSFRHSGASAYAATVTTPMRLATLGMVHEANTFASRPASLDVWQRAGILEGDEIRAEYAASRSILAGYFGYADKDHGVDLVPLVYSRITPMGRITAQAYDHLCRRLLTALRDGGPWDGVLLALHGAAVSEEYLDAEGELMRRVREIVGPDVPVGATLDMHANVSSLMVESADVITAYQTNPHVDAYERAFTCADLIARTVRGEFRPRMDVELIPLAANILRMGTDDEPMRGLLGVAREAETGPGVLSISLVEGFPYADVPEMGMSVIAVADDDAVARAAASRVADAVWAVRTELVGDSASADDALTRAAASPKRPVVLLDTGDNVGGGSPGDSTHILHAARRLGITGIVQVLSDPEVVQTCLDAGVGGMVGLDVGGKTDTRHGAPLPVTGVVTATADGAFEDATPTHGGFRYYDHGPTACLRTDDGNVLVLVSEPAGTTSLEQFRLVGVEPAEHQIVVAKGVHSPRPAFEPIAAELIYVGTAGATSADLSTFAYEHRRVPMFPFEADATWETHPLLRKDTVP